MWMIMSAIWNAMYGAIMWIIDIPKKLMGLSMPAQVALLVWLFLVICVVIVAVAVAWNPELVPWRHQLTGGRVMMVCVLIIAIPIVVYKALKLWLEGEASRFPDIDYAWKAGLAEMDKNGLDINQIPLFLIIGSATEQQERSLFGAGRVGLRVRQTPQGPAAIHWYANPDGIYLVATEAGTLSRLANLSRTITPDMPLESPVASSSGGGRGNITGTMVFGQEPEQPREEAKAPTPSSNMIRGTMVLGGGGMDEGPGSPTAINPEKRRNLSLPPNEAAEQQLRLQYLCQLIRRARSPLCPLNGMLTLLPYEVIASGPREGLEVQRAVQSDMGTILNTLQLRCPVTAVVVGMETDPGFVELVHRVGQDRAVAQRFGKGFEVWTPPEPEQLEALTAHACGAFEDWVYTLFRERGSLSRPGNTKLYAMLCRIRRNLQSRLTNIITGGFGHDREKDPYGDALLFSGCYFAATGDNEDQQAFVKGVFDKLPELQEELEWSRQALLTQSKYLRWAYITMGIDFILAASLTGMVVYKFVLNK